MAKLVIELDDDLYKDLMELARRYKTTVADLIRSAIDDDFEDDLDAIRAERILKEYRSDPESFRPLDEVMKEMGIEVPSNHLSTGRPRAAQDAKARDRSGKGNTASTRRKSAA